MHARAAAAAAKPASAGDDHAHDRLALAADVEQAAAEGQRHRQAGEDQRRGVGQRLRDRGRTPLPGAGAVDQRCDRLRVDDRALEQVRRTPR